MPRRPASSELLRTVSERVRARRSAAGWTQEQLAEASGIQATTISRIERGKMVPTLAALNELARAMRTTVGDLAGDPASTDADERRILDAWRGTRQELRVVVLQLLSVVEKERR